MEILEQSDCQCLMMSIPNETKWTFRSKSGVSFPIPNFFETYEKQFGKKLKMSDIKWWQQTPYVGDDHVGVACYITFGLWENYSGNIRFNLTHSQNVTKLARAETGVMIKRLEKLESLFDHIRQKSSMLDEFIKIAEECVKEESVTTNVEPNNKK